MGKLPDYIHEIPLTDFVKEHLKETNQDCQNYVESIRKYGDTVMNLFLLDCYFREMKDTAKLENAYYSDELLDFYDNVFVHQSNISENLIKNLQAAVIDGHFKDAVHVGEYRTGPAWIGKPGCSISDARFVAIPAEEISDCMKEFISFYNTPDNQHAFIKGAIAHVLFTNIHPFNDGNGRVSRILQEQKMTDMYGEKLHITFQYPLLNLSCNYKLTRGNYYQYQNNIYLGKKDISIEDWNKWFNYVLNMLDEQLYYLGNKIKKREKDLKILQKRYGC